MILSKPLREGDSFELTFKASLDNAGSTVVVAGWTPKDGQRVPSAQVLVVRPGETSEAIADVVPPARTVHFLSVDVDVPEPQGAGVLTLRVNGQLRASHEVTRDSTFKALVQ